MVRRDDFAFNIPSPIVVVFFENSCVCVVEKGPTIISRPGPWTFGISQFVCVCRACLSGGQTAERERE